MGSAPGVADQVAAAILSFVSSVPRSNENETPIPAEASRKRAVRAAVAAASASGTLALPPGPLGWLTILPELLVVWKIQAQMVADIAGLYGKKHALTQEQMLYCLFRHSASHAVREMVVQVGERMLVKRASIRALKTAARRVGVKVTQRVVAKGVSRWLPVVGAFGVAGYAYYDTAQVARVAMELFERDIDVEHSSATAGDIIDARP